MRITRFIYISTLAVFALSSCGGSSDDKAYIQYLEGRLASLEAGEAEQEAAMVEEPAVEEQDSEIPAEPVAANASSSSSVSFESGPFNGTYEFTDNAGTAWVLVINSDETATIQRKNSGGKYYGSWEDYRDINRGVSLELSDERPGILFPSGDNYVYIMKISKDGYLYKDGSAHDAKNPRQRLALRKVK